MLSLAPPARAGVEGRIETTSFPKIFDLQVTLGLDTAGEHRLLDQRIAFGTNCQVASENTELRDAFAKRLEVLFG